MKKYIFLIVLVVTVVLQSCSVYTTSYVDRLTVGMTIQQVEMRYGAPRRVLEARQTPAGFLHVLEYRNRNREVYALEFWDNYLVGYEYLYDDYRYVVPVAPPQYRPAFGSRVVVIRQHPQRPVNTRVSNSRTQTRQVTNQRQDNTRTSTTPSNTRSNNNRSTPTTTRESQSNTRESQSNRESTRENTRTETNRGRSR